MSDKIWIGRFEKDHVFMVATVSFGTGKVTVLSLEYNYCYSTVTDHCTVQYSAIQPNCSNISGFAAHQNKNMQQTLETNFATSDTTSIE